MHANFASSKAACQFLFSEMHFSYCHIDISIFHKIIVPGYVCTALGSSNSLLCIQVQKEISEMLFSEKFFCPHVKCIMYIIYPILTLLLSLYLCAPDFLCNNKTTLPSSAVDDSPWKQVNTKPPKCQDVKLC